VERDGYDIAEAHLHHGVRTGLSFGRLLPPLVPLYEEMEAMRFAGYNERAWRRLEPDEKALHVAHFRVHGLVEMHKEDAVAAWVKREQEKAHGH
jgi:hypothetical protein